MVTETDLELSDGRTLHGYDAAAEDVDTRLVVFWHHGTPNLGTPPEPLLPAAAERGIRWCRTTGPVTVGRRLIQAATWPRRPPTSPASPTRSASDGSR